MTDDRLPGDSVKLSFVSFISSILLFSNLFVFSMVRAEEEEEFSYRWNEHPLKYDLPVTWEITKSDFSKIIVSQTENYREVWTIEMRKGVETYLSSPRSKVPVTGVLYKDSNGFPTYFIIKERDLAKLLGILVDLSDKDLIEEDEKILSLKLIPPASYHANAYDIQISNDKYFSINLVFGR